MEGVKMSARIANRQTNMSRNEYSQWIEAGFTAFGAKIIDNREIGNDQSTSITLTVDGIGDINGSTGEDHGHAEMDALDQLIEMLKKDAADELDQDYEQIERDAVRLGRTSFNLFQLRMWDSVITKFDSLTITMKCEDKPCCLPCSTILGKLGILHTNDTTKEAHFRGSTQWGLTNNVKDFLNKKFSTQQKRFVSDDLLTALEDARGQ